MADKKPTCEVISAIDLKKNAKEKARREAKVKSKK